MKLCILALFLVPCISYSIEENFEIYSFRSNYREYKIGDVAPEVNFTHGYEIKNWSVRHLPAPKMGTFWSYLDGTYVLLKRSNHKIISAKSSDIFYHKLE